ncbi:MAG: transposase [Chitinophagaceae bacterium]|nr:transposase [Chitinophagaceae bacterium]
MEITRTYRQNLYAKLVGHGFDVVLVNGKQTKNVKGKKTDLKDCQWIQKLHSPGLLFARFWYRYYQNLFPPPAQSAQPGMRRYIESSVSCYAKAFCFFILFLTFSLCLAPHSLNECRTSFSVSA